MVTPIEFTPASSAATGDSSTTAHECDFCGRAVHPGTAVERGGNEPEVVMLCGQCAFGMD